MMPLYCQRYRTVLRDYFSRFRRELLCRWPGIVATPVFTFMLRRYADADLPVAAALPILLFMPRFRC